MTTEPPTPPGEPRWPLYVLAGGRSSRFGANKALADVRGRPLIVASTLPFAPLVCSTKAVVDRPDRLVGHDLPCVVDDAPFRGPAHGLLTALRDAPTGWVWIAPCDLVGLTTPMLRTLIGGSGPDVSAVAWRDARWQPLPSLWHTDCLPQLQEILAEGHDALWQVLDRVGAQAVPLPSDWARVHAINSQEDLARALG